LPSAALIDAADGGDAGGEAGPGEGADVVASLPGDDPLPPQEATPAISKTSETRRAADAAWRAVGTSVPFV